tara:strand:- start:2401 stop:5517 length:3117 start_codon:yes stop_codon:yes gene_type:complete
MSVKRFKFVSPGVFLNEIDNSQLPRPPAAVGPTVIGRLEKGPGLIPLTVDSMTQFVEVFGNPMPGGQGGDVWRDGNRTAPTYAAYAAQAFLQNSGPVNVVRLLGVEDPAAATAGAAGWKLDQSLDASDPGSASKSAIYGLYLFSTGGVDARSSMSGHNVAGHAASSTTLTGTLAAVWYMNKGGIILSGAAPALTKVQGIRERAGGSGKRAGTSAITASHALVRATQPAKMEFAAFFYDGTQTAKRVVFNFDRDSDKYIRKVFNTNPTLINAETTRTDALKNYFLGETFDRYVKDVHGQQNSTNKLNFHGALSADDSLCGAILPLHATDNSLNRDLENQNSCTGWFISQDLDTDGAAYEPANMQKLFRLHGINDGGWNTNYLKVSISDIKAPTDVNPYGSFTVLVRRIGDNDARPIVLERFSQCTLNPNSRNYIGRKIGDQYREWDTVDQRYRIYGNFPNQSSFFRVEIQTDVDAGATDPALLPFGFIGPPRYKTGTVASVGLKATTTSGGTGFNLAPTCNASDVLATFSRTSTWKAFPGHTSADLLAGLPANATASLVYPTLPLRISSSAEGLSENKRAYFGVSTYRTPSNTRFDPSFTDVTRRMGKAFMGAGVKDADGTNTEVSFHFSLDDLVLNHRSSGSLSDPVGKVDQGGIAPRDVGAAFYIQGSRKRNLSYTAKRDASNTGNGYKDLIRSGYTKFTAPVYGGFDGLDITEKEAFRNSKMSGKSEITSYEIASLKRAIDSVADPEVIEMNTLVAPGVTEPRVTNHMISVCEDRADALAIIDIENGGYVPNTENNKSFQKRISDASVDAAVNTLEARGLNSSYACCFFPWVKIADTINDAQVWVPPSVTALGTFGSTEARSELWFAPAGFTRGGLSDGAGGLPVLQVSQRLSSKDRDELYEANVNPIAQFPAEGIVVFGQKTLQVTQSALDRINVRRLMIFVKKEVSRKAATLLFDQNVQATWDRFRGSVEPFLDSVKSRFGLTEFRVVLDETTTTPDLIDRNIMYAKIFLKPARAIEFIAIDFVITNTGASFED